LVQITPSEVNGLYVYPNEFVAPRQKELKDYHLRYAQALYYSSNRYGSRLFEDDSEFDALVEFAQGRASIDRMAKLFGRFGATNNPSNDGPESLMRMDLAPLQIVPKYVNRAVSKMTGLDYDINIAAIDVATIDEVRDYESAIAAFYRIKDWMGKVKLNPQEFFPELDIESLPEMPDEMLYNAKVNSKTKKIISAEKTIKLIHKINNMRQRLREVCWDIVVIGRGHFETFPDENLIPRIKRINPKYWMGSYIDNEDFSSQENAGYIDFITINQFRKEAFQYMSSAEVEEICDHYGNINSPLHSAYRHSQNYDGLSYIPVLRYYFLSNDQRTYRVQSNGYGNPTIKEVANGYEYQGRDMPKDLRVIENQYTSVYGGTWIIDSDVVYGQGRKGYPRTNLVNLSLPIKTFAPNMKQGRVVSYASQMIEPVFMANVAWNKMKEIIAKGWMGIREIDFNQLEKVSLGNGNNVWTPRQVYEYFLMSNTLIKRGGAINQYDQSYGEGVRDVQGGLMLADYMNTFSAAMRMLESQSGSTLAEQFDQPDRLAVGVQEDSARSADIDMEWLYNAHDEIYEQASHQLLLLAQEAKKDKVKIAGVIPALGKSTLEYFEVPDEMAYTEYGLFFKRLKNLTQLWGEFYLDVREALRADKISLSDSAFLRSIDNFKEAQEMLGIREENYRRKQAKIEQVNQQAALQANAQAAQMKTDGNLQEQAQQGGIDKELVLLQGQIQERLKRIELAFDNQGKQFGEQMKLMTKKQEGIDRMVHQTIRNRGENQKSEIKNAGELEKVKLQAELEPKEPAKK